MGKDSEFGNSALSELSQSLGSNYQNDEDFSDVVDYSDEIEINYSKEDDMLFPSELETQVSKDLDVMSIIEPTNIDVKTDAEDVDMKLDNEVIEASLIEHDLAEGVQKLPSDLAVGPGDNNEVDEQVNLDELSELNLDVQQQIINQILANAVIEEEVKSEDKNDHDLSKNDKSELPKKHAKSSVPPAFNPSLLVSQDTELEVENVDYKAPRDSQNEGTKAEEAKLKVEQDNPIFPKELLKSSYKLKLVANFRFSLKSVEINSNDRSMDLNLSNGALIKDFGKDFMASGSSPEELAIAAVKMAKTKGWRFIKAAGEPEYLAALENECRKSNLGIRREDAARLQSAVERFRKTSAAHNNSQEQSNSKNADVSPANAKPAEKSEVPAKVQKSKEIAEASEIPFEPQIGKF